MKTSKNWYALSPEESLSLLRSDQKKGLAKSEIDKRQQEFGENSLTESKGHGSLMRFILQFNQALVYILIVAVIIKIFLGAWVDAGVIFGVVLLNAVIGFAQEGKALSALEALSNALTTETTVLRNGEKQRIDAKELVPGDIVILASGDKVPADLRFLHVRNLQVDESALTGESLPVEKKACLLEDKTSLADRVNMGYSSTLVTYGTAVGMVVKTGDNTEIGLISELIASTELLATPLTRKIARFSHLLLYAILTLAILTFLIGLWHGSPWVDLFMAAVALSVAMIPEGLPAVLTITLAIGVARMAKRNAIIRRLPAVETLGSTTIICSDKTGTLTRNEMTVNKLWAGGENFEVTGIGYMPKGDIQQNGVDVDIHSNPLLSELILSGLLCNDSLLKKGEEGWKIEGDPTEGSLLVAAKKAGFDFDKQNNDNPRLDTIPFESQHQYMATLHSRNNATVTYMKGSVESVLARCTTMGINGRQQPVDKDTIHDQVENMAGQGLRVLAFAKMEKEAGVTTVDHGDIENGMVFIGLQGMIDPPRESAIQAVRECRSAGIRVKMITGDHIVTAAAIAKQLNLDETLSEKAPPAFTGSELEAMSEEELSQAAKNAAVFARVSPEQKLRLVESLQNQGAVVAMTGDGVNDAPALRKADIGVAMGITGTEVSKEAADMVLTDDNFATIKAAVEEGRGVFDNLVKFISWILPTNAGQGLVVIAAVVLAKPLPMLPAQVLWINMTTAVLLGLALAFEPREPGTMSRPPRPPSLPILSGELIFRIALVGFMLLIGSFALFELALYQGASEAEARTIAVNVFAVGQTFYLLNCRSMRFSMFRLGLFTNPWIWIGIAAMSVAQLSITYLPFMNRLFHTAPIGGMDWLRILGVGLIIYFVTAAEKEFRRRMEKA